MNIQDLIKEYENKVSKSVEVLETISIELNLIKRGCSSTMTTDELNMVLISKNTQRNCYIQIIRELRNI